MLTASIGIVVAIIFWIIFYKKRILDEMFMVAPFIGMAAFTVIELAFYICICLTPDQNMVTDVCKIMNNGNYYNVSNNGEVSLVIVDENGDGVPVSYPKSIVEFKEGDEAKVEATYIKGCSNQWALLASNDEYKKVVITIPNE